MSLAQRCSVLFGDLTERAGRRPYSGPSPYFTLD